MVCTTDYHGIARLEREISILQCKIEYQQRKRELMECCCERRFDERDLRVQIYNNEREIARLQYELQGAQLCRQFNTTYTLVHSPVPAKPSLPKNQVVRNGFLWQRYPFPDIGVTLELCMSYVGGEEKSRPSPVAHEEEAESPGWLERMLLALLNWVRKFHQKI